MRFILLLPIIFLFSACTTTTDVNPSTDKMTEKRIASNLCIATDAQNEYKKLQEQRKKEV